MDATTIALVLVPVLILQVGLMLYALYDLFQEDRRVRGDSKIVWALIIFFVNLLVARHRGALAAASPWGGSTLEWSVASPPPVENFHEIPTVTHGAYAYGEEART